MSRLSTLKICESCQGRQHAFSDNRSGVGCPECGGVRKIFEQETSKARTKLAGIAKALQEQGLVKVELWMPPHAQRVLEALAKRERVSMSWAVQALLEENALQDEVGR